MSDERPSSAVEETALLVQGMNCASCVAHVQNAAQKVQGVQDCSVNLARGRAVVRFDPHHTDPESIAHAISDSGYPSSPESAAGAEEHHHHHQVGEARAWFWRAVVGILLWFPVEATHWILELVQGAPHHAQITWMTWAGLITSTIALVYVGAGFYRSAFNALLRFTSNMDTLIAMGATVAWGYSAVALLGYLAGWWSILPDLYFMESTGLLALISLGHWLEARARQSAGSAIRELLELAPATAHRFDGENTAEVPVSELKIGDQILVRPGDRIPIDGQVIKGPSSVNESMITGESLPVTRDAGDSVIGGTQNLDGRLIVSVTKTGSQTALAQIIKLVEHAQASKPAIQRLADQVAAIFVPTVLCIALVTGIGWYIWGYLHSWDSATTWGRIALTVCSVLIIACPCALGLAVPAALMVGTGRGAKMGILIRDIDALQKAESIDTIVLDKTGTITEGKPSVMSIAPYNTSSSELLRMAASVEQYSSHPLAKAIVHSADKQDLKLEQADSFSESAGLGVRARFGEAEYFVGREEFIRTVGNASFPVDWLAGGNGDGPLSAGQVYVSRRDGAGNHGVGIILLRDEIKKRSYRAIDAIHEMGLNTMVLSGDNVFVTEHVALEVKAKSWRSNVKPDGKASVIKELQNEHRRVAMVGDGINDAPALAQADLGIAIGSGSDIAKQTSDIVLVGGSLHGIAAAIRLSRATMRTIRQNLFFAFIYNVLAIPLAAMGLLNPYIAAAAMAFSDVTVIGNALLLRRSRID